MEDIFSAKEKDRLLNLCKNNTTQVHISSIQEGFFSENMAIAKILKEQGYINLTLFSGGGIYWATNNGIALKERGGFTAIEESKMQKAKILHKEEKWWQLKMNIANWVVTLAAAIIAYFLGLITK